MAMPLFHPAGELFNGLGLIPLGFKWRDDFEVGHKNRLLVARYLLWVDGS